MRVVSSHGILQAETDITTYRRIFFPGKSGQKYDFTHGRWKRGSSLWARYFFVTKRSHENKTYLRSGSHESIFIGQTDNLSAPLGSQTLLDRFTKTRRQLHFACTWLQARNDVLAAEQDLIGRQ